MAKKERDIASTKRTYVNTSKKDKTNIFRRIFSYFKELKNELKKVVWPNRKKIFNGTMVVIVTVIFISLFVVLADFAFHNLLKLLIG